MLATVSLSAACGGGASAQQAGSTLTIAVPSFPPSLDPATGANDNSTFYDLAYDPLIVQAPDGAFQPGLAESWKYGPQNKSFTITLRPGVKFSDGTPLNAAAVKTWIEHEMQLQGGRAGTYLGSLASMDVTGPQTLTLVFAQPTPLLPLVFSQILEMGMIGSPRAVQANTLATSTDGAGPYMLDAAATVARDHYTFVPNPHYWNKSAVHWKKVVVKVITSPSSALEALRTGEVQVAKDQPVTSVQAAQGAGLKYADPLTLLLGLSLMDRQGKVAKPLGDVRVRQALNYAVDRNALAKVIGAGYGRPTTQMAVPGDDSFDPALEQMYPYDPPKARRLLTQAGYPHGFTLPAVSVNIVGQDVLAQALVGQFAKIGVTLKPSITTNNGDYAKDMSSGTYPAATLSFGRLPAAIDYQLLWGPDAAIFNPFKTASTQLAALDRQLSAAPAADAPAIAQQMQAFTVNQAWFVPATATPLVVLYRPDVTGVNTSPQRDVVYTTEIKPA